MASSRTIRRLLAAATVCPVLLLSGPGTAVAQLPTPDREALSVAEAMIRRGASAGQVATEVTRNHRQSTAQTGIILREVGFRSADATAAFVADLRIDPSRVVPVLREVRYDADGVAAGLARARLSPERIVAELGAARFSPTEIVRAQRSALRRDVSSAWTDLRRSGLLEKGSDDLVRAFLEVNVRDASGAAETHEVLVSTVRYLRDVQSATVATVVDYVRVADLGLAEALATFREAYDMTAGEALAWLLGETSAEEALELVREEYGLDLPGLVDSVVEVYDHTQDQFHLLVTLVLHALQRQNDATDAIVGLHAGGIPMDRIFEVLVEAYGSETAAASALVSAGVASVGEALALLEGAGATAADAAAWLYEKGLSAAEATDLLVDAGYAIRGAVAAVAGEFAWTARDAAVWLAQHGVGAVETIEILVEEFPLTRSEVVEALQEAGFPLDQIWPALVSAMQLSPQELIEVMGAAGLSFDQIAAHLVDIFSMSFAEALGLVAQVLG